jgi:membrane associated rhomboid family serine protease
MQARFTIPPVPSPLQDIPAPTRRQAMDWSLVLASQGIEHIINHDDKTGWTLAVSEAEYEKALTVIRLYRQENRHWRWRQPVFRPGFFFDWSSLIWVLLAVFFYAWSETNANLRNVGMMDRAALTHGEWWRLFTATWLHADIGHLAANVVFGLIFLGLAMGRYGPGVGLLAAYLAGVGGNVAAGLVHDATAFGLGASGVVMGALGLLSFPASPLPNQRGSNAFRLIAGGITGGILLFVFVGVSPESDVVAHLGGFVTGLILGALLATAPRFIHRPRVNLAAGILFAVLVILPWWWALRRIGSHY